MEMEGGEVSGGDERAVDLPPPPPVPEGAVPVRVSGYNGCGGTGSHLAGPSSSQGVSGGRNEGTNRGSIGNNGGSNGGNGGRNGGGHGALVAQGQGSTALAALGLPVPKQAIRLGYGTAGRPTTLFVNHFRARLLTSEDVFHYNVAIEPPVTNKKVCRDIMKKLRETFGDIEIGGKHGAYDGEKSLFTSGGLSFNSRVFEVFLDDRKAPCFRPGDRGGRPGDSPPAESPPPGGPGQEMIPKRRRTAARGREFTVRIEFAAKIRMKAIEEMLKGKAGGQDRDLEIRALDALRVLDIILRESASEKGYLLVRDNFFHRDLGEPKDLGEGVEGWRGYHSSVRPTGLGLTLNLDITMTTILKPILVEEFLKERFNVRDLNFLQGKDWSKAKSVLKGVRVETTHMAVSRTHKIGGFSGRPIRELKFTKRIKDNQGNVREEEMFVEEYYFDVYKYNFKYPNLPALDVGNRKKPTFIPIELCKIVEGQRYTKPLSRMQRTNQIAACKQGPTERKEICENAMEVSRYSSDKLVAEFGLAFENKLATVSGRMLPPPQLEFGRGRSEQPRDGRWNFNRKMLQKGVGINRWAVAVFDERCHDGDRVAEQLMQMCCTMGMKMEEAVGIVKEPNSNQRKPVTDRVADMMSQLAKYKPVFVLVILPAGQDKDEIYVAFKRYCEIRVGVISQCMVKPRQLSPQYLGNLALKINLKMGGFNSPLHSKMTTCLGESTIIFGMDVSHGSPGDDDSPSIAAVVATKNWPTVFHYAARARTQPAKAEMIEGLYNEQDGSGMVSELLLEYYKSYKGGSSPKPKRIIIYRDGVSESQFEQCLQKEAVAFKRACKSMDSEYNPGITFIVAQKRHNTRFFPEGRDALRNGNVIPGTVVDKDVCHPHNYDFFLVSQAGLIGTSRPTHYHVLVNENKLGPDEIQSLTNNLCYTFGRCSTAISMAAPAAYAHVVATRYRKLVDTWGGSDTASTRSSREGGAGGLPRPVPLLPALSNKVANTMFFC